MALGGRGSERVRLSGRWRPDPESRSVVSKDWAKWKGRGPSPGTAKNRVGVGHEEGTAGRSGSSKGMQRGAGAQQGCAQEDRGLQRRPRRWNPSPDQPLAWCTDPAPPWRSSRTHPSAVGCERLRGPGGERAAGERARGPQPQAPGRGAGRGEHGGFPGLAPEDSVLGGSCGHHQPGGKIERSHREKIQQSGKGRKIGNRRKQKKPGT